MLGKRSAFEDNSLATAKNAYEYAMRTPCKAMKGFDMRPHWLKNEGRGEAELAGKDDEEAAMLAQEKKALQRTDFDETMDMVLSSQDLIHARALITHSDRMRILADHLGIPVWERACAEGAPGAQRAAAVSRRQIEQQRAEAKAHAAFSSQDSTLAGLARANAASGSTRANSRSSSKAPSTSVLTTTAAAAASPASPAAAGAAATTSAPTATTSKSEPDLLPEIINAPHISILTPPFHGYAPISHKHLLKGALSYKMDNAVQRMNEASVQFQQANEAARKQAQQTAADFARQHDAVNRTGGKRRHTIPGPAAASPSQFLLHHQQLQQQQVPHDSERPAGWDQQQLQQKHQETSHLLDERMARERRLADGLFTNYHRNSHVAGLVGSPYADPNASGDPRFSDAVQNRKRRYPEPHAFVIH